jgi:protein-disulfide isomerase
MRAVRTVVVGVLLVAVLVAGLAGCGSKSQVSVNYPTTINGSIVVGGKQATNIVDVYEDYLCPFCGRFETRFGGQMAQAINDGKIQVRYHAVDILNRATNPAGYSLRAANAGICSAEVGVFPAYHAKLFDGNTQPQEGSAGLTDQQLVDLGTQVGAPASFASCVTSGKYGKTVTAETNRAAKDASLRAQGSNRFATPTITVNGKPVDLSDDNWLTNISK